MNEGLCRTKFLVLLLDLIGICTRFQLEVGIVVALEVRLHHCIACEKSGAEAERKVCRADFRLRATFQHRLQSPHDKHRIRYRDQPLRMYGSLGCVLLKAACPVLCSGWNCVEMIQGRVGSPQLRSGDVHRPDLQIGQGSQP